MYCYTRDKIRALWQPAYWISSIGRKLLLDPQVPFSWLKPVRSLGAIYDIIHRWTRPNKRPDFNIPSVQIEGVSYPIISKIVYEKPFCRLTLFQKENYDTYQPTILVVAPLSGHYATLLRDTVHTLLEGHRVYLTDWISGYNVSLTDGIFNLDTYVDYLKEFLSFLGGDVHVLAVCQPAVPVLMVTAVLAAENVPYQPKSIILMGGPIDTRVNPTRVNKLAERYPLEWFEKYMISEIPFYATGAGRKVTPGNLILGGFIQMNFWMHMHKHLQYILNVANQDEKAATAHRKFYDEYLTVMDLAGDYFLQTVDKVFKKHLIPQNKMNYHGNMLDFLSIKDTGLMTIEGENDDITGVGQTQAAHRICKNIPDSKRDHLLIREVGHYGVFSGSRWREFIYPRIRSFIQIQN